MQGRPTCCFVAGRVSGVQSALQSLFGSFIYVPSLILHSLDSFRWMMLGSVGVVSAAALLYSSSGVSEEVATNDQKIENGLEESSST